MRQRRGETHMVAGRCCFGRDATGLPRGDRAQCVVGLIPGLRRDLRPAHPQVITSPTRTRGCEVSSVSGPTGKYSITMPHESPKPPRPAAALPACPPMSPLPSRARSSGTTSTSSSRSLRPSTDPSRTRRSRPCVTSSTRPASIRRRAGRTPREPLPRCPRRHGDAIANTLTTLRTAAHRETPVPAVARLMGADLLRVPPEWGR